MSRLRQNNSGSYNSSGNIDAEFENLVRYINSAEYGNKTIAELLALCFDTTTGQFDANLELRLDTASGIQYRSGDYTAAEEGWTSIVDIDDIRGNSGVDVGTIGEPIFQSRFSFTAAGAETEIDIAHTTADGLIVFKNGLLQVSGAANDYTSSDVGGTLSLGSVTFLSPLVLNDEIEILKIAIDGPYVLGRFDVTTVGAQSVFGYEFTTSDSLLVYLNGLLQKEGGGNDYLLDPDNDSVNFTTPVPDANDVTIISAVPKDTTTVAGLMTEANFTNNNGFILYNKLVILDDEIGQAKVNGLVPFIAATPDFKSSGITPDPATRFWLDTSTTPSQLKFYDGSQYLSANPSSQVPSFDATSALTFLRVDASGTSLSFESVDFSSLVPKTQKAAVNGVASLDSASRLPVSQLPVVVAYDTYEVLLGTVANGNLYCKRILGFQVTITRISVRTSGGTCDVDITVDGVDSSPTFSASVTPNEAVLASPIDIDGTAVSRLLSFEVSNNAAGVGLEIAVTVQVKSQ